MMSKIRFNKKIIWGVIGLIIFGGFLTLVVLYAHKHSRFLSDTKSVEQTISLNSTKPVDFIPESKKESLINSLLQSVGYKYRTWKIIDSSLKRYDVDGDGREDVIGFIRRGNKQGTSWRFVTWFNKQNGYYFYDDGYWDFSFFVPNEEKDKVKYDVPCDVIVLEIGKITLDCNRGNGSKNISLHYSPKGKGYYTDPEESIHKFTPHSDWQKFTSKTAGVEFQYPDSLTVVENFYKIRDKDVDFIEIKNGEKLALVIYAYKDEPNDSGGILPMTSKNTFLQNLDGQNFVRQKFSTDDSSNFVYYQAKLKEKNNKGSIFNAYNQTFGAFGINYVFYSFANDDEIKQVDDIMASTKFFPAVRSGVDYKKVEDMPKEEFKIKTVSWKLPGVVTKHKYKTGMGVNNGETVIGSKDLDVRLIDSAFFYPTHIIVKLLPYKDFKFQNPYGDDGFDAKKNKCYYEKYVTNTKREVVYEKPKNIDGKSVCVFGSGDAGYFIESSYVLGPDKKYILLISQTNDGEGSLIDNILTLDLTKVIETVKF